MKVKINRDGCINCGLCTDICPEIFRFADDGLAEVYKEPTDELSDGIYEAAENCPVEVIAVEDD